MTADQRWRTIEIELPLLRCSEIWPIFKNISKRRNFLIMGIDTNTCTAE
jgi:hypothetical protein